jgi:hypothetical protein
MEQLWLANREKEFVEKRFELEMIDRKKQMCFEKMKMKQKTDHKIVNKTLGNYISAPTLNNRQSVQKPPVPEKITHTDQLFRSQ